MSQPANTTLPAVKQLLACDDSCQQQLYVQGHIELRAFTELAKEYAPFAVIDQKLARHAWMYFRPIDEALGEDDLVSDEVAVFLEQPAAGAEPVTVLDDWLPLWERQTYHERHVAYVAPTKVSQLAS